MTNAPSVMPGQMTAIKPTTTASAPRQAREDLDTIRTGSLPFRNMRMAMTALLPDGPNDSYPRAVPWPIGPATVPVSRVPLRGNALAECLANDLDPAFRAELGQDVRD